VDKSSDAEKNLWVGLIILLFSLIAVSAHAGDYGDTVQTVILTNNTGRYIDFEFTDDGHGHVWPGGDQAYRLPPHETTKTSLNCYRGQKICYGAWVRGDDEQYWGAGNANSQHCNDCCFRCEGDTAKYRLSE